MLVVQLLQKHSVAVPWPFRFDWEECLLLLNRMQVHVSHIYREGNQVADKLSNLAIDLREETWWSTYPAEYQYLMQSDVMGRHSYHFQ